MAFSVDVTINRDFEVGCPIEEVFEVLADVPYSVSHFPKVDQLVDLGDNAYQWEMAKIGLDRYSLQTIYACKYTSDAGKGTVKWTPVKGVGNATVKGQWTLKSPGDGRTKIKLATSGTIEVPLPSLLRLLLAPIVSREFEGLIDQYIKNLTKTFESPKKSKKPAPKKKK